MKEITTFTNNFTLIKNGDVEVTSIPGTTLKSKPRLQIVGDDFSHVFPANSRVSEHLADTPIEAITARFQGGHFFTHDGNLIDWRDSQYAARDNFVHTDDGIQHLINHIGFEELTPEQRSRQHNTASSQIALKKVWSNHGISIPEYGKGGELDSQLSFVWNPFNSNVGTSYDLVRLICANGMTGVSNFFTAKIPLVNDWEEGLEIANKRIQSAITTRISNRLLEMGTIPATVRDCNRMVGLCQERLTDSEHNVDDPAARQILTTIQMAADPKLHLTNVYDNVLLNQMQIGDQLQSHLTLYTLWNMLTEISTHTHETQNSTTLGAARWANEVLIDRGIATSSTTHKSSRLVVDSPSFSNVEAALSARVGQAL
jgi:hypothetical protein